MVKLFLSNRVIVILLLPFIIGMYLVLGYATGMNAAFQSINLGFFGTITATTLITTCLSFILLFLNSYLINLTFNKNGFYDRNIFIPSLLYVVLMSFYHSFYVMDGLLIAHTFLLLCLMQLFQLYQNEDGRKAVFNAAFFAGVSAVVHPPIIMILPLLFMMVWSIRPFVLRESLLLITGFGIPLIYGGIYLKWLDTSISLQLLKQATNYENNKINFLVTTGIFLLMMVLSLIGIQAKLKNSSIRFKKLVRILWVYILIGALFGISDYMLFGQIERFSFILLPIPFFLPYSFTSKTWGKIASILFYITFAYSIVKFFI